MTKEQLQTAIASLEQLIQCRQCHRLVTTNMTDLIGILDQNPQPMCRKCWSHCSQSAECAAGVPVERLLNAQPDGGDRNDNNKTTTDPVRLWKILTILLLQYDDENKETEEDAQKGDSLQNHDQQPQETSKNTTALHLKGTQTSSEGCIQNLETRNDDSELSAAGKIEAEPAAMELEGANNAKNSIGLQHNEKIESSTINAFEKQEGSTPMPTQTMTTNVQQETAEGNSFEMETDEIHEKSIRSENSVSFDKGPPLPSQHSSLGSQQRNLSQEPPSQLSNDSTSHGDHHNPQYSHSYSNATISQLTGPSQWTATAAEMSQQRRHESRDPSTQLHSSTGILAQSQPESSSTTTSADVGDKNNLPSSQPSTKQSLLSQHSAPGSLGSQAENSPAYTVKKSSSSQLPDSIDTACLPNSEDLEKTIFKVMPNNNGGFSVVPQRATYFTTPVTASSRRQNTSAAIAKSHSTGQSPPSRPIPVTAHSTPKPTSTFKRRLVTPASTKSIQTEDFDKPIIVAFDLMEEDVEQLCKLHRDGACVLAQITDRNNQVTSTQPNMASQRPYLIVDTEQVDIPNSISSQSPSSRKIQICRRTFPYLQARALGWDVVSSRYIQDGKEWLGVVLDDLIWGDDCLYEQVKDDTDPSLRRTDWFNAGPSYPPLMSSRTRVTSGGSLFSDSFFVILNDGQQKKEEEQLHLSSRQVRALCKMLQAKLQHQVDEQFGSYIVLVPDLVDRDTFIASWFDKMKVEGLIAEDAVFAEGSKSEGYPNSRVKFVYFSWIAESISWDRMAPLEPYCLGYLK
jgi:hypothetical protein